MQASIPSIVYVVTVNWNRSEDTLECIRSLYQQENVLIKLVIVDNGSCDHSVSCLRQAAPEAHIIETGRNLGFAGGYNVGLRYCLESGAQWILIINNDTIAAPDMISKLVEGFSPDTAAVGPLIFYASQPTQIWSQGGSFSKLLLELKNPHRRDDPIPDEITPREFLSGCCLLLQRSAIEQVGLLDDRFFLYYEDQDWCLRFFKAGWQLKLVPQAHLWHKVSVSSNGNDSPNERYWMARSSIRYFYKHIRGWVWLVIIPWRMGSVIKTTLRLVKNRKWKSIPAFWKGLWDGIVNRIDPVQE